MTGYGYESIGRSKAEFKAALRKQVINISFAVMGNDFYQYSSGVLTGDNCSQERSAINHAMTAVGYGVDQYGTEYTIIRNSWNTWWGDGGYIKVALLDDNAGACGVYLDNTLTLV